MACLEKCRSPGRKFRKFDYPAASICGFASKPLDKLIRRGAHDAFLVSFLECIIRRDFRFDNRTTGKDLIGKLST